jgi:anti-sigma factor RsiW
MNDTHKEVTEDEIHAYVDGTLSSERREEIDGELEVNPALADRISGYFSLNHLLHERYDRVLDEPIPKALRPAPALGTRLAANASRYLGVAAALVLGVGIGVGGMSHYVGMQGANGASDGGFQQASLKTGVSFAEQSAIAHVLYVPDAARSVAAADAPADREDSLVQEISNRVGSDVRAPLLKRNGYALMGGRLLPNDGAPIAQFMYRDARGDRVTVCISHLQIGSDQTTFKPYRSGAVNVYYWTDGNFEFSVSGGLDRHRLLDISHEVYEQWTSQVI